MNFTAVSYNIQCSSVWYSSYLINNPVARVDSLFLWVLYFLAWPYELHDLLYNKLRVANWIFMKFGLEILPLEASPQSYLFPAIGNTNVTNAQCHEVRRWCRRYSSLQTSYELSARGERRSGKRNAPRIFTWPFWPYCDVSGLRYPLFTLHQHTEQPTHYSTKKTRQKWNTKNSTLSWISFSYKHHFQTHFKDCNDVTHQLHLFVLAVQWLTINILAATDDAITYLSVIERTIRAAICQW
jgi:hypothetical protein